MLRLGKEKEKLTVVFDQVGTPTYAADLAAAMLSVIENAEKGSFLAGVYHYSNEGVCSWYDFTVKIHQLAGISDCKVLPVGSDSYPTKARRPHYSVLDKSKIKDVYQLEIPHWETSLRNCLERLAASN